LHRDIKPANIYIRTSGSPVLLDFGAARQAVNGATKSLTAVLTPGYAPLEQYSGDGNQGPWSDIYAMAGVLYRGFTNENPPDAVSRLKNDSVPAKLAQLKGRVSEPALRAVDWALALDEKQRPASVELWKRALQGKATVPLLTRSAAMPVAARTVVLPTAASAGGLPATRSTTTYHAIETAESASMWRWIGIALALFVLLMGGRAWYTQREAKAVEKLNVARMEMERRAEEQRQADQRSIQEREAQLQMKERSALEREEAARRAADREEALRRLDEERAVRERIVAAAEARKPTAMPPEKREFGPPPMAPRIEDRPVAGMDRGFEQKMEQDFRHMDANGDGFLSPNEVRGPLANDFARVDANGDGRISLQEFIGGRLSKPPPKFK
jgi:hypothetical protein